MGEPEVIYGGAMHGTRVVEKSPAPTEAVSDQADGATGEAEGLDAAGDGEDAADPKVGLGEATEIADAPAAGDDLKDEVTGIGDADPTGVVDAADSTANAEQAQSDDQPADAGGD